MPKDTSTNQRNLLRIVRECPLTYTFTLMGNRWKPIILWKIKDGENSSAALLKVIPLISRKMLFQDLRELLECGLVTKQPGSSAPPVPTYALTALGDSLIPILTAMLDWGEQHPPELI